MQLEYCTAETRAGLLRSINFPNVRKLMVRACLEAVTEQRDFTYTDIFRGVTPREDEH